MATESFALWAEPAPITAEQLFVLSGDSWRYELVEGRLVRMPPTGLDHADIEAELGLVMRSFANRTRIGKVYVGEPGFLLSTPEGPDTVLAPDIAFVRAGRVPQRSSAQSRGFPRLCPDLVVEIGSPSQTRPQLSAKASLWLSFGARLVWVVWPDAHEIDIWRRGEHHEPLTIAIDDTLDGEGVLPGFLLLLKRLFA